MHRVKLSLRIQGIDSPATQYARVNGTPAVSLCTESWANPRVSSPPHKMILTKTEQIVPKPEEEAAKKKKSPETEETNPTAGNTSSIVLGFPLLQ